jgi:hypothetical protein
MPLDPTSLISNLIGGSIGDAFSKIVGAFKVPPEQVLAAQTQVESIKLELQGKLQDALANEVTQSSENIRAEAQSQSWLPRNVRPLLLLFWGSCITFNYMLPLLAHFTSHFATVQPLVLPDWVYKLTVIGFTGYAGFRTFEKWTGTDN